ncbi:MAG: SH3 domain-containing protein [Propionivibrio sp.]
MKRLLPFALGLALALPASAIEYRTVDAATILYDAPSQRGRKLFVIRKETPVEVVVSLEGWAKVRDAEGGGLAWIEKKYLADRRTLIVTADRAEVRERPDDAAPIAFEAEKNVALEYLDTAPGDWAKVRHRDGQAGFVHGNQVWGY